MSKKLRELKCLFRDLKDGFKMYLNIAKPLKTIGTRWTDHHIYAIGCPVKKFGLYTSHLKEFIDDNLILKVKAAVRGKVDKLLE